MLDPKEEELLELEKENNKLLRDLHSDMIWTRTFTVLKWLVIIGAMFGAYYYIQPYIEPMVKNYENALKLYQDVVKSMSVK